DLTATTVAPRANAPERTATPTTAAPGTTAAPPTTAPPPTTPATAAPPPTVPPPPASLDELIAFVEQDPGAFGEKADDFLDDLRPVADEQGRKQSDKAAEVLRHTEDRVAKGELIPDLLPITQQLLQPLADGPGNDSHGPVPGGEGDDDEG